MKCYRCGAVLKPEVKFCNKCGAPMGFSEELIRAAQGGDQEALTELYNRTYNNVYLEIRALISDEDTALDILQDSYVKAFRSLGQLHDPSKFRAWIKRIAHNRAVDHLRRTKPIIFSNMVAADSNEVLEVEDPDTSGRPEVVLEQNERGVILAEMLESLPADQRTVVVLHTLDQLTFAEIAAELGVSESTVKSRFNYATRKLNNKVEELKKRGYTLRSISGLPLLLLLFRDYGSFVPGYVGTNMGGAIVSQTVSSMQQSAAAMNPEGHAYRAQDGAEHAGSNGEYNGSGNTGSNGGYNGSVNTGSNGGYNESENTGANGGYNGTEYMGANAKHYGTVSKSGIAGKAGAAAKTGTAAKAAVGIAGKTAGVKLAAIIASVVIGGTAVAGAVVAVPRILDRDNRNSNESSVDREEEDVFDDDLVAASGENPVAEAAAEENNEAALAKEKDAEEKSAEEKASEEEAAEKKAADEKSAEEKAAEAAKNAEGLKNLPYYSIYDGPEDTRMEILCENGMYTASWANERLAGVYRVDVIANENGLLVNPVEFSRLSGNPGADGGNEVYELYIACDPTAKKAVVTASEAYLQSPELPQYLVGEYTMIDSSDGHTAEPAEEDAVDLAVLPFLGNFSYETELAGAITLEISMDGSNLVVGMGDQVVIGYSVATYSRDQYTVVGNTLQFMNVEQENRKYSYFYTFTMNDDGTIYCAGEEYLPFSNITFSRV